MYIVASKAVRSVITATAELLVCKLWQNSPITRLNYRLYDLKVGEVAQKIKNSKPNIWTFEIFYRFKNLKSILFGIFSTPAPCPSKWWWHGVGVSQQRCFTPGPVITWMGGRL